MLDNRHSNFWVYFLLLAIALVPFVGGALKRQALENNGIDSSRKPVNTQAIEQTVQDQSDACYNAKSVMHIPGNTLPEGCE